MIEEFLAEYAPTWSTDGFGDDSNLIAPVCGCMIEQDGRCHHGRVSPLVEFGLL